MWVRVIYLATPVREKADDHLTVAFKFLLESAHGTTSTHNVRHIVTQVGIMQA